MPGHGADIPTSKRNGRPDGRERPSGGRAGPVESTLSIGFVRGVVQAVEQLGVPRSELLGAAGLDASQLEAVEDRLSRSDANRLFELAIDLTADPALGMHLAEAFTGQGFVPTSHLVAHSVSLRQGIESLEQFQALIGDDPYFELREQGDEVTLRCLRLPGQSLRLERFSSEMITTSFFRLLRYFSPHARPERVGFEYAAPPHRHEYARVFENLECFEQPFTGIVFDRALLDVPSPDQDEDVHEALRALAERRTMRLAQAVPYALRVREFLVQQGAAHRTDMETVARSLGLSVRSLRRRLASEGKSYGAIESDALAIVAKQLLRDEQRTIQETAYEMGFSDTTTFHRAFKRWTGTTPSAYRQG
jgi:AraC-like DNA-binding protein